jgi:hypothetical protein
VFYVGKLVNVCCSWHACVPAEVTESIQFIVVTMNFQCNKLTVANLNYQLNVR